MKTILNIIKVNITVFVFLLFGIFFSQESIGQYNNDNPDIYSHFISIYISDSANMSDPESYEPSTVAFDQLINYDTHTTNPTNLIYLLEAPINHSIEGFEGKKIRLYTNQKGELIWKFSKGSELNHNFYKLFHTRVHLKTGYNLLQLEFDKINSIIWATVINDVCNSAVDCTLTMTVDQAKNNFIGSGKFGNKYGEGVAWRFKSILENEGNNIHVNTSNPTLCKLRYIGGSHDARKAPRRFLSSADDGGVYAKYIDADPLVDMPIKNNIYYLQNKKTGLVMDISGTSVIQSNKNSISTSQLWQIMDTDQQLVQFKNMNNQNLLKNSSTDGSSVNIALGFAPMSENSNLKWKLIPDDEGYFTIKNLEKMIDGKYQDNKLKINNLTENDEQKWRFVPFTSNILAPACAIDPISTSSLYNISGWAYDPDNLDQPLDYTLKVDNTEYEYKSKTSIFRNVNTSLSGNYGFEFPIPYSCFDGLNHNIWVRAWDGSDEFKTDVTKTTLSNVSSPAVFKYNPCAISVTALSNSTGITSIAYGKNGDTQILAAVKGGIPVQWNGVNFVGIGSNPPSNLTSIDVGNDGVFWAADNAGNIRYCSSNNTATWTTVNLPSNPNAKKIACHYGDDYTLAFINSLQKVSLYDALSNTIFQLNNTVLDQPTLITFSSITIQSSTNLIWATGINGNVYVYLNDKFTWLQIVTDANAKSISCGEDDAIFWISANNQVKKWNGGTGGFLVASFGNLANNSLLEVINTGIVAVASATGVYLSQCCELFNPSITSINPNNGPVGTLVTINGTNLQNATAVNIGNKAGIIISKEKNKLVAMVMPGTAATGTISITANAITVTSTDSFTIKDNNIPNTQQGNKIIASDVIGNATQGTAVGISADGNTAIVGAPLDNGGKGSARIYTLDNRQWRQQAKLIGTGALGNANQGYSVSISADGTTAMVGAPGDNTNKGAAWIFTKGSDDTWQGIKLLANGATGTTPKLGASVSLSADGNTAVAGGAGDNTNKGAIWVFTRTNGVWSTTGTKLTPSTPTGASRMGASVAISADGNTIIAGGPGDNSNKGAVWITKKVGSTWGARTKPTIQNAASFNSMGTDVSINADGTIALIGINQTDATCGAVVLNITTSGNTRLTQPTTNNTAKVTSVSISADGRTAVMGGSGDNSNKGAIWIYKKVGLDWNLNGSKMIGTDSNSGSKLGKALALSADGNTLFAGASGDATDKGAAHVFTFINKTPKINYFSPKTCSVGDTVEVYGENLQAATVVKIGTITAQVISNDGSTLKIKVLSNTVTGNINITNLNPVVSSSELLEIVPKITLAITTTTPDSSLELSSILGVASTPTPAITIMGTNLTDDLELRVPEGFELSFTSSFTAGGVRYMKIAKGTTSPLTRTVYARITANPPLGTIGGLIDLFSNNATSQSLQISGIVNRSTITTMGSFQAFANTNNNVASASQSITVNASYLLANITATAPVGFELSTDNISYASSKILPKDANNNYSGNLYLRLKGVAITGDKSGNLTLESSGANTVSIAVAGTTTTTPVDLTATTTGTIATTAYGTASAAKAIAVSGSYLTADVAVSVSNSNYELSLNGTSGWTSVLTLTKSQSNSYSGYIYIRLKATAPAGSSNVEVKFETGTKVVFLQINSNLVNKASLTITANDVTKIYGELLTSGSKTSGFTPSGLKNNESITSVNISYGDAASANASVAIYNDNITISNPAGSGGFNASNYTITYILGKITINTTPLTITANVSRVYGEPFPNNNLPANQFIITGLKNNEVILSVTVNSSNFLTDSCLGVGNYGFIYPNNVFAGDAGFNSSNYAITYNAGTITINKATLTIDASEIYKWHLDIWYAQGSVITASNGVKVSGLKNGHVFSSCGIDLNKMYNVSDGFNVFPGVVSVNSVNAIATNPMCPYYPSNYKLINTQGNLISHGDCYDNRWNKGSVVRRLIPTGGGGSTLVTEVKIRTRGAFAPNALMQIKNVTNGFISNFNATSGLVNTPKTDGYNEHSGRVYPHPAGTSFPAGWNTNHQYELESLTYFGVLTMSRCFPVNYGNKGVADTAPNSQDIIETNAGMDSNNLVVYPNPTSSVVNINYLSKAEGRIRFSIVSILGTELASETIAGKNGLRHTCTFNLKEKGLTNGVYILMVTTATETLTHKIIVN